jgi:hypothetical protein
MDLINYSVKDFLLNESKSAIQSIIEANEKNQTHERDQVWNKITTSIHELDRDTTITIREIESE